MVVEGGPCIASLLDLSLARIALDDMPVRQFCSRAVVKGRQVAAPARAPAEMGCQPPTHPLPFSPLPPSLLPIMSDAPAEPIAAAVPLKAKKVEEKAVEEKALSPDTLVPRRLLPTASPRCRLRRRHSIPGLIAFAATITMPHF